MTQQPPFPVGTLVRHSGQQWATRIPTGEIREVKGPYSDGAWEYLVRTGKDFSRRLGPDNLPARETWWASYATVPVAPAP